VELEVKKGVAAMLVVSKEVDDEYIVQEFDDLDEGEAFYYEDSVCMKISHGERKNAVSLVSGFCWHIDGSTEVYPLNTTVEWKRLKKGRV
jgi:hypothetical protein